MKAVLDQWLPPFSCIRIIWGAVCVYVHSVVPDSATPWIARQASLSIGFSRQEYWSGLLLPTQGALPDPGIKPASLACPVLAGGFFTTSSTWEVLELSGGLVKKRFLDL